MTPRRRWGATTDGVRWCSERCRRWRASARIDRELEDAIREVLARRARSATACPSEAARRVRPDGWRDIMERTRCAARRLAARGEVEWLQRGRRVDPSTARGPVRLRLRQRAASEGGEAR